MVYPSGSSTRTLLWKKGSSTSVAVVAFSEREDSTDTPAVPCHLLPVAVCQVCLVQLVGFEQVLVDLHADGLLSFHVAVLCQPRSQMLQFNSYFPGELEIVVYPTQLILRSTGKDERSIVAVLISLS